MSTEIKLAPDVVDGLLKRCGQNGNVQDMANRLLRDALAEVQKTPGKIEIKGPYLSLRPEFVEANFNALNDELETQELLEKLERSQ